MVYKVHLRHFLVVNLGTGFRFRTSRTLGDGSVLVYDHLLEVSAVKIFCRFSFIIYPKGSIIQIQEIVVLTQNISIPLRNLVHLIVAVKMSYCLATLDDCEDVINSNLGCHL